MVLTRNDLALAALACSAGAAILAVRAAALASDTKPDGSPVTEADRRAERIILDGIAVIWPGLPVIAEEAVSGGQVPVVADTFVLVDPLDGTREFIAGRAEFTVNIALVRHRVPVCGVVFAPATGAMFLAGEGGGAWRADVDGCRPPGDGAFRRIGVRPCGAGLVALVSHSHGDEMTEAWLAGQPVVARRNIGSSLKFCLIAAGEADVYPRFGPTMEWDTAAGDAVLRAAGGKVLQPDGAPFLYGKAATGFRNGPFIARGGG